MFIQIICDPKAVVIEKPKENHYNSDMISDSTTRIIKIKGSASVDVRQQTYDDRFSGRLDKNQKYDVVLVLRTEYLGEDGIKKLAIVEEN